MNYISLILVDPLCKYTTIIPSHNLDDALSTILYKYIKYNIKYILVATPYTTDINKSTEIERYTLDKKNNMIFIYKNGERFFNFDNYPKTNLRLNIISKLLCYNKDRLNTIYKELYPTGRHQNRYLTKKSTYLKHIYHYKNIVQYLNI
jgi:hypothetical protein